MLPKFGAGGYSCFINVKGPSSTSSSVIQSRVGPKSLINVTGDGAWFLLISKTCNHMRTRIAPYVRIRPADIGVVAMRWEVYTHSIIAY